MAEQISFGDTLILKGEKLLLDNDTSDGVIKSKNGTVKIEGNLTVSGTTTTVNSETVAIADNIIVLNSNETGSPSEDGGIEIERGTSSNKSLTWNETDDKWTVGAETFVATTFEGNLTGNITGSVTGDITSTGTSTFSGIDIDGGTIDSTVIGATTPVVGTFTTLTATTINGPLTGTVSSISNHDTDALSEGSTNLYYTDSRVDTHLNQSNPTSGSVLSWNGADYSWASPLLFDKQFSSLEAVPTTIAGYGITDAFDGAFASLSGKPTTLAGYGITDAATAAQGTLADSALQSETISLATLKTEVAASTDFVDFKSRIAAL